MNRIAISGFAIVAVLLAVGWIVDRSEAKIRIDPPPQGFSTVEYDNHLFILNKASGFFLHHPECRCQIDRDGPKLPPKPRE